MSAEETMEDLGDLDFAEQSADDWEDILEEHPVEISVKDQKGTHRFAYDDDVGHVVFYAFGSQGYDQDTSRSALEDIANQPKGIALEFMEGLD